MPIKIRRFLHTADHTKPRICRYSCRFIRLIDPNENVMFFRKTDDDVTEVLVQDAEDPESRMYAADCPDTIWNGPAVPERKTIRRFTTNLCTSTKGCVAGCGAWNWHQYHR